MNINIKTDKNKEIFNCEKCNYITSKQTDYNKHLLTLKHQNSDKTETLSIICRKKISSKYCCELCDYYTSKHTDYNKHLMTLKHKINNEQNETIKKSPNSICHGCSKHFNSYNSLWKHKNKYNCIKIDNKCCDVLFGEYLRRIKPDFLYAIIELKLYNYRIDDNSDSITGEIKNMSNIVRKPMNVTPENMEECAKDLDKYLDENIEIYIHDTYLRTIVGMDFDNILKHEFMNEYNVLNMVKKEHMQKIFDFHSRLRQIANMIFDIKL